MGQAKSVAGSYAPNLMPRRKVSRAPNAQENSWERCKTDPEPDMGDGRASARCSYVLQFTFRLTVCCVLHRPPYQVIHRAVSSLWQKPLSPQRRRGQQSKAVVLCGQIVVLLCWKGTAPPTELQALPTFKLEWHK